MRSPQELATAIRCAAASAARRCAGESNFLRSAIRNNQWNRMDVDHGCQLKQRGCRSPAPASCRRTTSARDCAPAAAQTSSISQPVREERHAAVLGFWEMPTKNFRFSAIAEASSATTNPSRSYPDRPIGQPELPVLVFFRHPSGVSSGHRVKLYPALSALSSSTPQWVDPEACVAESTNGRALAALFSESMWHRPSRMPPASITRQVV